MPDVSQLPTWAVYTVAFGTPTSAFSGVVITSLFGRRSAAEAERRARREEVMRLMRWSSELAISADRRRAQLGAAQLAVLATSELLGGAERALVDAALESALADVIGTAEGIGQVGDEIDVRECPDTGEEANRTESPATIDRTDG